MRHIRLAAFACAALALSQNSFAAPLFSDDFNTLASGANYAVATSDPTSSFATFAYDYSVMGIPAAPNSGGSTIGVKLDANKSASPNPPEAITLHTLASYAGDYTVKFDAWINVNGPFPDGGGGSTNYLTGGVGGDGTTVNLIGTSGKGGITAVNGENGSGIDYRLYKDTTLQGTATAQYAAGTDANARNGLFGYYDQFGNVDVSNFPVQGANNGGPAQQNGTSYKGSFGMAWHQVTLAVDADGGTGGAASVKWFVDNLLIGTLDAGANGAFGASGRVTVGYADNSTGASDNQALSFALIDNLQIVPEPATAALGTLGLMMLAGFRRR